MEGINFPSAVAALALVGNQVWIGGRGIVETHLAICRIPNARYLRSFPARCSGSPVHRQACQISKYTQEEALIAHLADGSVLSVYTENRKERHQSSCDKYINLALTECRIESQKSASRPSLPASITMIPRTTTKCSTCVWFYDCSFRSFC